MNTLKEYIEINFTNLVFEENKDFLVYSVPPEDWKNIAVQLNTNTNLLFDFLFCITCIDWKTHFTIVYHFRSTQLKHSLVIKINLKLENLEIETVSNIWKTAEFHEREIYDLFGVIFLNHPDLRRLFLTDEWQGYPLRKNYEDPINMIKL